MAYPGHPAGRSFQQPQPFTGTQFDVLEWYPHFQSCARYFLEHAQYSPPVQAAAAFINIQLPFQKSNYQIVQSQPATGPLAGPPGLAGPSRSAGERLGPGIPPRGQAYVTLIPYVRRLVATGYDHPGVMHSFFGDDWVAGIGPLHETERRNYLFAAKSENWLKVKASYDMGEEQTVPFLRPLQNVTEAEIVAAELSWSEWLAMGDWMLGPRALDVETGHRTQRPAPVERDED